MEGNQRMMRSPTNVGCLVSIGPIRRVQVSQRAPPPRHAHVLSFGKGIAVHNHIESYQMSVGILSL